MEYKNIFKSENGAVLEMTIKAECSTKEEMHKTISFIAKSARKFYLQTAEELVGRINFPEKLGDVANVEEACKNTEHSRTANS